MKKRRFDDKEKLIEKFKKSNEYKKLKEEKQYFPIIYYLSDDLDLNAIETLLFNKIIHDTKQIGGFFDGAVRMACLFNLSYKSCIRNLKTLLISGCIYETKKEVNGKYQNVYVANSVKKIKEYRENLFNELK